MSAELPCLVKPVKGRHHLAQSERSSVWSFYIYSPLPSERVARGQSSPPPRDVLKLSTEFNTETQRHQPSFISHHSKLTTHN
jgi:hypothetical protein